MHVCSLLLHYYAPQRVGALIIDGRHLSVRLASQINKSFVHVSTKEANSETQKY